MSPSRNPHNLPVSQRGAALLASLCFATVLAIALGSYITVCYRSLQMSTRHLSGSHSVELAEAGLEEALWALNKNDWSNGWTIIGTTATKTLGGFSYDNGVTGAVSLTVTNFDGSLPGSTRNVTASGTTTLTDGTSTTRTLTSSSARAPLFLNAVAATTGRVKFRVAGTVDSYNSALPDLDATTVGYSAIVASGSTSTTSATVQLTNTQIKGYVATLSTGPSYSTSAKVVGPTTPVSTKIDLSRLSTSPYQPLFEEIAPSGTATILPSGTATVGTAGASAPQLYTTSDLTLSGSQILTIDGPVTLNITGNLSISSTAKIVITATGSLEIHLAGDLILNGNGIQNLTKLPRNLLIIAKADNYYDTLGMATNMPFHGVIYTPNNSLTISNSQTIYGAIVAKAVTFSASPIIHYDLSLRDTTITCFKGIDAPFAISNWRETTTP
jgi:Tfp pilus assembly protein PilX